MLSNLVVEIFSYKRAKCALQISILKGKIDLNMRNDCKPGPRNALQEVSNMVPIVKTYETSS